MTREGGCLCGAVRFKAEGEPINVRICHCRNCQKAMGSPFFARALFDQRALTVEGETARYASSEALERVFCKACGTRLFSWRTNGTVAGVALAAFDDRNAFAPTEHIWVSEKIDWVQARRRPAAISGDGSAVTRCRHASAAPVQRANRGDAIEHLPLRPLGLGAAAAHRHHLS